MTAIVKDYQMPASEQRLADYLGVWGRRQIILNWPLAAISSIEISTIRISACKLQAATQETKLH